MRGGRQLAGDRPSAVVSSISWLRERRALSLSLALVGLAVVLVVDLVVPGYAIAAAYLLVVIFAAIALPRRTAVAIGSAGLVLTLVAMATQGRMGDQNLLLVGFGVLAGAGMFVLVSLHDSVESLYTEQRKRLEHESFTVRLVDALLPLPDPVEVEDTTTRLLGEQLGASRTAFYEVDEAGRLVERSAHARRDAPAALDLEAFAADLAAAGSGRALVLRVPAAGPEPAQRQRTALDGAGLQSCLAAPIQEDGELVAAVVVCGTAAREWTQTEADLLEASVARAWAEVRRARSDAALRETESRLRDTLDSAVDGVYRLNVPAKRFDYISPSAATITGVPLAELRKLDGPLSPTNVHPDDRAEAARAARDLERDGMAELSCRWGRNGTYRWYSGVMRLTRDERGEPLYRTGTFRDVTERKRREQNLALLADLQDRLAQVTSVEDVMDATGSRLGAYLGVDYVYLAEIDPGSEVGSVDVLWRAGRRPGCPPRGEAGTTSAQRSAAALRDGEPVVCRDTDADPRTDAAAFRAIGMRSWVKVPFRRSGQLTFVFAVADGQPRDWRDDEVELLRDVAARVLPRFERARAEEARRASEARFRLIVTTANEGIAMSDPSGVITYANDRLAELLGFARDDLIGRSVLDLLATDAPGDDGRGARWPRDGARNDFQFTRRDGSRIWLLVTNAPLRDDGGRYVGNLAMLTDITKRKATEAAVARQARLLDSVHDAILAVDGEFKVTYWNDQAEELFGWTRDEALGRSSEDLLQGDFAGSSRDAQLASLLQEGSYRGEVLYSTRTDTRSGPTPIPASSGRRAARSMASSLRSATSATRNTPSGR